MFRLDRVLIRFVMAAILISTTLIAAPREAGATTWLLSAWEIAELRVFTIEYENNSGLFVGNEPHVFTDIRLPGTPPFTDITGPLGVPISSLTPYTDGLNVYGWEFVRPDGSMLALNADNFHYTRSGGEVPVPPSALLLGAGLLGLAVALRKKRLGR